jgi:DNA-directed RNA polymerase subunit RPC12/RpoP
LDYFEKTSEKDKYKCTICKKEGKEPRSLKMIGCNDSGLRKHLGGVHDMSNFLYASQKKQLKAYVESKEEETAENSKSSEFCLALTKERIKQLNEAVVDCIIEDGRSFNDFRKRGMIRF